jgi:hypothetical protein
MSAFDSGFSPGFGSVKSLPWPIDTEGCGLGDIDPKDPIFIASVATAASIMTRLSGYTVGTSEAEIRPLNQCRECRSWCCGGADAIPLSGPFAIPVWEVIRVRLGAEEYPTTSYRFDRPSSMLYRVPPDVWPNKDEKWSHAGEGNAFVVDTEVGTPPDTWALDVAARLAKELYLSCTGAKCRLPSNVTNVTSQGITVRLRDEEVNTFIPELGAWVHAVNPHNARLPGAVFSPDLAAARRGSLSVLGCPHGG